MSGEGAALGRPTAALAALRVQRGRLCGLIGLTALY